MMRFKEILSRLTGISTSVFGVSWTPPEAERAVARRVIAFLEDRRVLFVPSEMENPEHCVRSVLEIRALLTTEIGKLKEGTRLAGTLGAIRAACRKFLDTVQGGERSRIILVHGATPGHWASWEFNGAVGEMRGVFGVHLAILAAEHGLDIEKDLASILPQSACD